MENIKAGSEIIIIKEELKKGQNSKTNEGVPYEGVLSQDIKVGGPVRLDSGMNTSDIVRIYPAKKPEEVIIETNTSIYKIIQKDVLQQRERLNENMKIAAQYMERLDHFAECFSVDGKTGKIHFSKPQIEDVINPKIKKYQENFAELQRNFHETNNKYVEEIKKIPGILDAKNIMGTVIITFDSSKTPELEEDDRGSYEHLRHNKFLGLVKVDLNSAKRFDGVSPTISVIHEIQHHVSAIMEYLMSKDNCLGFKSRKTQFRDMQSYKQLADKVKTKRQAIKLDKEKFTLLFNRNLNSDDFKNIDLQGEYLDELHSSFLQRKENWFHKEEKVYAMSNKGKHWEIIGNNPKDIEATKNLLIYMQGFFMCGKLQELWDKKANSTAKEMIFTDDFKKRYRKAGSLIGISKTVKQSEEFLAEEWKTLKKVHPEVFELNSWKKYMESFIKSGVAEEKMKELL